MYQTGWLNSDIKLVAICPYIPLSTERDGPGFIASQA